MVHCCARCATFLAPPRSADSTNLQLCFNCPGIAEVVAWCCCPGSVRLAGMLALLNAMKVSQNQEYRYASREFRMVMVPVCVRLESTSCLNDGKVVACASDELHPHG